jgi:mRNA interferase MazF
MPRPVRGEIWMIDLDPTRGHEQAGHRPGLVISADAFNAGPAGLVIVLPLTSKRKAVRSHVPVDPPEGGLRQQSFIKCEDVRSVALERLSKRLGRVAPATLEAVEFRLRILMEL